MGRRRKKSKLISSYFDQQHKARSKKFTNTYDYYTFPGAGTAEIRAVAEKVFGNPYGFKVKKYD